MESKGDGNWLDLCLSSDVYVEAKMIGIGFSCITVGQSLRLLP